MITAGFYWFLLACEIAALVLLSLALIHKVRCLAPKRFRKDKSAPGA